MTNLVATTPITAKAMKSLYAEMNRQRDLKRSYRRKYKNFKPWQPQPQTPVVVSQPLVVTSTRGGSNPQMVKATSKVTKPPNKRKEKCS